MRQLTYGLVTVWLLGTGTIYGAGRPEDAGRPGFADRPGFAGRPGIPGRPDDPAGRSRAGLASQARIQQALESRGGLRPDSLRDPAGPHTSHAGAQAGTGRLGSETHVGQGVAGRSSHNFGDWLTGHRRDDRASGGRPDLKRTAQGSADDSIQATNVTDENGIEQTSNASGSDRRPGLRPLHDRTTQAERLLAQRLASIDCLRDIALQNGNTQLLERADQLEELARRQLLMRTEGQKLDWGSYQKSRREGAGDATPDETAPTSPGESIAPDADSTPPSGSATEPGDG